MTLLSTLLSITEAGEWHPGIGDPTPMGWLTVGVYGLAAALAWRASSKVAEEAKASLDVGREVWFWRLLALGLLLLGINKQLDLQTLFTELARHLAHEQGWYEERRRYQRAFIAAVGLVGAFIATAGALWLRRALARVWLALVGVAILVVFVVVRAASFHHVDLLLGASIGPMKINWLLELGGLSILCVAAARRPSFSSES